MDPLGPERGVGTARAPGASPTRPQRAAAEPYRIPIGRATARDRSRGRDPGLYPAADGSGFEARPNAGLVSRTDRRRDLLVTLWVYPGVRSHAFMDFDDSDYVFENPNLAGRFDLDDLVRAFREPENSNWSSLTSLSLVVSDAIHGPDPGAYALTNVGLHAIASLLLFLAFGRLTGRWGASAGLSAVFAVHPIHVESVAWISQRKDVLAGVFWMATLAAYPRAARAGRCPSYSLVFLLGTLAPLSKPTAVTLPLTLLLLDYWPLGRLRTRADVRRALLEKTPLLLAAAAVAIVTHAAQTAAGANATAQTPLPARLLNAGRAYAIYVVESLWPVDLAYFHPFPAEFVLWSPPTYAALAAVIVATALSLSVAKRHPAFTMGWLWFLLTLVPMIGLVRVGGQAHADRYVYIAQTGLVVIVVFALPDALAARIRRRTTGADGPGSAALPLAAPWPWVARSAGLLVLLAFALLARAQVGVWRDSITLFSHATRATRDNAHAHRYLGVSLWQAGDREGGARHLVEALRIRPDWGETRLVWATALLQSGQLDAAPPEIERAARDGAAPALVWAARGVRADAGGEPDRSAEAYERALALDPDDWEVANNLAWIRTASADPKLRDPDRAVALACRAEQRMPEHAIVLGTLAAALTSAAQWDEATDAQTRAIARLRALGEDGSLGAFAARLAAYRAQRPPWQSGESER